MVWQQSYKYFSIELSAILLDDYGSLKILGPMGDTSSSGNISLIYKFIL